MTQKPGYTVVTAAGMQEALDRFEQSPGMFDVVITDKTMPNGTGFVVAKTIKAIKRI